MGIWSLKAQNNRDFSSPNLNVKKECSGKLNITSKNYIQDLKFDFSGLSAKCYIITDNDAIDNFSKNDKVKCSSKEMIEIKLYYFWLTSWYHRIWPFDKGTPNFFTIEPSKYIGALFDQDIPQVEYSHIAIDNRVGTAVTKKVKKKALNPIYYKGKILDNLIEVKPLRNTDGSYV